MEKRIRIIWALSLILAALAIGVQSYWLYNQYIFVIDAYATETAENILKACEMEHEVRKAERKAPITFFMQKNTTMSFDEKNRDNSSRFAMIAMVRDSITSRNMERDSLTGKSISFNNSDTVSKPNNYEFQLKMEFNPNIPEEDLQKNITRTVTDIYSPFRRERLDSVFSVSMPSLRYSITGWPKDRDSLYYYSSQWEKTGGIFHPGLTVFYAYNPFDKKGICINTEIPAQPVFGRMAIQLILSLGLILLLIVCLVFQIKTILKQKKISELRENFVNTMIHELKRPVQTLKTFLAFLGDRELRSDEAATLQVVQDSMFEIDNLSAYLNKLRDIIRTDRETTPLNITRFNLRDLIEKVIRLTPSAGDKTVNISAVYEMESFMVEADPVHVANILSNLIENAIKYSGMEVRIEIKAQSKGKELMLCVTDNGIGIPFAEQEKVFAKFYRASNLPDKNIPGLGLGLSYVKLVTEAHRGNVSLQSKNGDGTSVMLCFPQ